MEEAAVQLGLFVIEEAIKNEPALANELRELLNKNDPSSADWAALRAKVASRSYRDYVPETALPPETAAPPASAPAPVMLEAPVATPAAAPAPAIPAAAPATALWTGQTTDPHAAQ